jgi:hypothetical protein
MGTAGYPAHRPGRAAHFPVQKIVPGVMLGGCAGLPGNSRFPAFCLSQMTMSDGTRQFVFDIRFSNSYQPHASPEA